MALAVGTKLGPYEIQSALGAGGMGEVYRARDTRLDRTVAIKILRDRHSDLQARFAREAKVIAALTHPHICTLFDIGREQGVDYLVMECLEGETLSDRLKRGALLLDDALKTAIEIGDALDRAHHAGIVHRDLKPSNVMLTKSGAKLLDFGMAKVKAASQAVGISATLTQPPLSADGTLIGTVPYMAPEQLEGRDADVRSDLFAFGAVLYEMVTGRRAFAGESQASVIAAILEHDPSPISTLRPQTPPTLDRVIKKCLAKDPEARWQTAHDLVDELKWIAEGMRTRPDVPVESRRRRWVSAVWLAATVAALSAIVTSVVVLRRPSPDVPVVRFDVNTPPTSDPTSFALSPDGQQLAFVALADEVSRLWLRPFNETTAHPLAGTDGATFPFWAPDSRALGFFADAKLKRIDLSGGSPQILADAGAGAGGTWNRDGVILFAPTGGGGLMRVAAAGGTPTDVTRPAPGEYGHVFPVFLPDQRRFLFFMGHGRPEVRGEYVGTLDSPATQLLVTSDAAATYSPGCLLIMRAGVLMAIPFDAARAAVSGDPAPVARAVGVDPNVFRGGFSVSATGLLAHRTSGPATRSKLVWIDRTGAEMGTLWPLDENLIAHPELSPDGQRVAVFRRVKGNVDTWLIDATGGVASRFTTDPAADGGGIWSPDGSRLIFGSNRNGAFDLFEKPASGARDEQLVFRSSQNKAPTSWSRDGRSLVYVSQDEKTFGYHLWVLPLQGARTPLPLISSGSTEVGGQFSPDGRWIAYASDESGRREVYLRSFPGPGRTWLVSTAGGSQARWRRDGKELFYIATDTTLMAVPIGLPADGPAVTVGSPIRLFRTHLPVSEGLDVPQYAVARDGRRFLMNVVVEEATVSPITIVQNWTAGLRQK